MSYEIAIVLATIFVVTLTLTIIFNTKKLSLLRKKKESDKRESVDKGNG